MIEIYFHYSVIKYMERHRVKIIVDNGYLEAGYPSLRLLINRILRYQPDAAIGPDSDWKKTLYVKKRFPHIKVVYPIHYEEDLKNVDVEKIDYIGYATLHTVRFYSLKWFLTNVPKERRFMLGFSIKDIPVLVKCFKAGDTVIPQFNAFYHKNLYGKRVKGKFPEILRMNIEELQKLIKKYMNQQTLDELNV